MCREKGTLLHCWLGHKLVQPLRRTIWRFLKTLKPELPHDPAIPLLDMYLEKNMTKTWKQPKCPSGEEWTKKTWDIIYNGL